MDDIDVYWVFIVQVNAIAGMLYDSPTCWLLSAVCFIALLDSLVRKKGN